MAVVIKEACNVKFTSKIEIEYGMGISLITLVVFILLYIAVWYGLDSAMSSMLSNAHLQILDFFILRVISAIGVFATLLGLFRSYIWLRDRYKTGNPEKELTKPFASVQIAELESQINLAPVAVPFLVRNEKIYEDFPNVPRLAILGQGKIGKSRESLEYIRKLVKAGQVIDGQIICPKPGLIHYDERQIRIIFQEQLGLAPRPVLFLDELDLLYRRLGSKLLAMLTVCMEELNYLPNHYVIVTFRPERVDLAFNNWLTENNFQGFLLEPLNNHNIQKIVSSAAPVYKVDLTKQAIRAFVDCNNGTPYMVEVMLRKLTEINNRAISRQDIFDAFGSGLREFWIKEYKLLQISKPAAAKILSTIGDFFYSGAPVYTNIFFPYLVDASNFTTFQKIGMALGNYTYWYDGMLFLTEKYSEVRPPDKVTSVEFEEALIEDMPWANEVRDKLAIFLVSYRRWADFGILKNFHRSLEQHVETILGFISANEKRLSDRMQISLYSRVISLRKTSAAVNNRGAAYERSGNRKKALADFKQAISLPDAGHLPFYNYGFGLMLNGRAQDSLEFFSKSVDVNPSYVPGWLARGQAYEELEELDLAIDDFTKVIELDPGGANGYFARGAAYSLKRQRLESEIDFAKAIELDPKSEVYCERGAMYLDQKEYTKAYEDLTKAIMLTPGIKRAYYFRGQCNLHMEKLNEGISDLTVAIEARPDMASAYYFRGLCFLEQEDYMKAIGEFNQSIRLANNPPSYLNRGVVYSHLENHKLALKDFTQAIKLDPNYVLAFANRATVYIDLKDYKKAIKDLNSAIKIDSNNGMAHYIRAGAYQSLGDKDAATDDFLMAKKLGFEPPEGEYSGFMNIEL